MTHRVQPRSRRLLDLAPKLCAPSAFIPAKHHSALADLIRALVGELQPRNLHEAVEICEFAQSFIEVYTLTRIQYDLVEGRAFKLLADMPEELYSGIPMGADEAFELLAEPPARKVDDLIKATAFMDVIDQVRCIEKLINSRKALVDKQNAKWRSSTGDVESGRIAWRKPDARKVQG